MHIAQQAGELLCGLVFPLLLAAIVYRIIAGAVGRIRRKDWASLKRYLTCLGIALLLLFGIFAFIAYRIPKAMDVLKCSAARGDMSHYSSALELYRNDVADSTYPATLLQLYSDNVSGWAGPYLATITNDPWDNQYRYQSDGSSFTIMSVHRPPAPIWSTPDPLVIKRHSSETVRREAND